MARKKLVADLFCGAGGFSTGCANALAAMGIEMELVCVNHWPVAIETHTKNHPEARHYIQDLATARPFALVPEGYLDLLLAAPSCTHHSPARGGRPTSDQQRADPWHILPWFTELRVKRAIIENVWAFTDWGPVDPKTGRPIKDRKGEYFLAWREAIRALGATSIEWRRQNAADFGEAQTRQRFIMMIRFDSKPLVWPVTTHRKREEDTLALFPSVKPWRPSREIIDWSIRGKSIFSRKKNLAPKTLARIQAGAVKFGWPEPFLVILRRHMAGQSIDGPMPTIAANGNHIGLAEPVIFANKTNNAAKSPREPIPCATTSPGGGIVVAEPIILSQHSSGAARSTGEPLPTVTTGGAGTVDHPGCARPMVIEPFVLSRQGGGAPRAVDEPTPAQVAKHSHILIAPYYGSGSGETCKNADQPLDSLTTKARFGMVVPVKTHGSGTDRARDVSEPMATVTASKRGEFGFVMPITHSDGANRARNVDTDPVPTLTTAHRGELAFITAQHGERAGQSPRVHGIGNPAPTIAARGHVDLAQGIVTPVCEGEHYDILFRMLEPHELAAAQGLDGYRFAGTKTEQVKQIGNAVPEKLARAHVTAIMADAVPSAKKNKTTTARTARAA